MVKDRAAAHYLADALADALFSQPGPTRLSTLLTALPEGRPAGAVLAQEVMASDSRFAPCVTRWDLTHRAYMPSRPLGGALEALLDAYGRPMPRALLIAELCLTRTGDPRQNNDLLDRLLLSGRDFGAFDDLIYLTKWLPQTTGRDLDSLLFINGLATDSAFVSLYPKLTMPGLKQRQVLDTAEAVLKLAKIPLPNPGLGLVLLHHHGDKFSAAETLLAMCEDERFLCLSGPQWLLATAEKAMSRELTKAYNQEEDFTPPSVDLEAILHAEAGQRLKLDPAVAAQIRDLATCVRTPLDVEEILTDVIHVRPRQKQFVASAQAVDGLLSSEMTLLRVGSGRYLPRLATPQWVRTVPEALVPQQAGERLLPLDELAPGLAGHVTDPFYEDQGEAEVAVGEESVDATRIPVAYHHFQCGTLKLRLQDLHLFDVPGPVSVVSFITPEGDTLPVWVNTETRLLYGLLVWYQQHLPPAGALLEIERNPELVETYHLASDAATDQATYIGKDRLAQLEAIRTRLSRKRATLAEVLAAVLHGVTKGLAFDQLWAQVNVIRRVTRLQVASVLTAEERFEQMDGGRWRTA
ncbi:MAG: hypothetical protein ABFD96_05295 [Armatimonadia bacterium]